MTKKKKKKDKQNSNNEVNENLNSSDIAFSILIVDLKDYKKIQGESIGHGIYGVVYLIENTKKRIKKICS